MDDLSHAHNRLDGCEEIVLCSSLKPGRLAWHLNELVVKQCLTLRVMRNDFTHDISEYLSVGIGQIKVLEIQSTRTLGVLFLEADFIRLTIEGQ